jgi:MFS family permease
MLLFSPIVLALSVYMGLIYAYFYLLFTTFTPIFEENYHFPPSTVGLSYLGVGVGFLIGQASFARLGDIILKKCAVRFGKGDLKPEYRLPLCCLGSVFVPIALFWYGWSVVGHMHWLVPIVGTGLIGLGNALIFVCLSLPLSPSSNKLNPNIHFVQIAIQAYVVDAFTLYAASALAANTLTRSVMAAVLPLAGPKMYKALGLGWGNSLLAFLALAMIPVPCLLMVHGEKMRMWNVEKMKNL